MSGLVLGVDGGGSKTNAWLAHADNFCTSRNPLGTGVSGPSNPQSVSWETAFRNIDQAIDSAFHDSGQVRGSVAAACVGLAGAGRAQDRSRLELWAKQSELADQFVATHDALPLLAAGTPEQFGVALVAGTGSFAFGQSANGTTCRAGGWGYLFGDDGSGYAIALSGLHAVARADDGRGEKTQLSERFLQKLNLADSQQLLDAVYAHKDDRTWIAALAEAVFAALADEDLVACQIIKNAMEGLAELVASVARTLQFPDHSIPLALGGGILVNSTSARMLLVDAFFDLNLATEPVSVVTDPVIGAVILAIRQLGH